MPIVDFLLKNEVDVRFTDSEGWTALHNAVYFGHIDLVKRFLSLNARLLQAKTLKGKTVLHLAAEKGYEEIVKLLLDYPVDLNALEDNDHFSALMIAAKKGHAGIAKLLMQKNADLEVALPTGETAICLAVVYNQLAIVQLLLDTAKLANETTNILCELNEKSQEMVNLFLDKQPDLINLQGREDMTPLHIAAGSGLEKATRVLLERNALVDIRDRRGRTPLHEATVGDLLHGRGPHIENMKMLLNKHSDLIDKKDGFERTALHLAAEDGLKEAVQILLDAGADINAKTAHGYTALHLAVMRDHKDTQPIVQMLLEKGANYESVRNNENLTPVEVATPKNAALIDNFHKTQTQRLVQKTNELAALSQSQQELIQKQQQEINQLKEQMQEVLLLLAKMKNKGEVVNSDRNHTQGFFGQ